jgi:hypothetical protein
VNRLARRTTSAFVVLVGIPAVALLSYDLIAIRPHLAEIEQMLRQAPTQDADPPLLIRRLIDANSGSPTPYATRLALSRVPKGTSSTHWHMRYALWQLLLPLHLGKSQMYGLYATLAPNGTDVGLSALAQREFGQSLDTLSPAQAAAVVATTHGPGFYGRYPARRAERAKVLLERAGIAP